MIELTENPDILQAVAQRENAPFCVGFAAESENVLAYARAKRAKRRTAFGGKRCFGGNGSIQ